MSITVGVQPAGELVFPAASKFVVDTEGIHIFETSGVVAFFPKGEIRHVIKVESA